MSNTVTGYAGFTKKSEAEAYVKVLQAYHNNVLNTRPGFPDISDQIAEIPDADGVTRWWVAYFTDEHPTEIEGAIVVTPDYFAPKEILA